MKPSEVTIETSVFNLPNAQTEPSWTTVDLEPTGTKHEGVPTGAGWCGHQTDIAFGYVRVFSIGDEVLLFVPDTSVRPGEQACPWPPGRATDSPGARATSPGDALDESADIQSAVFTQGDPSFLITA